VVDESKPEAETKRMINTRKGSSAFKMMSTEAKLTAGNRNTTKTSSDNKGIRFPTKLLLRKNSAMVIKDESKTVEGDFATSSPVRNLFDLLEVQYMTIPPARKLEDDIDEQSRDDTEDFFVKVGSVAGADEQARQVDDYSLENEFVKISNKMVVSALPPETDDDLSGNIDTTDEEEHYRKEDEMPDKSISNGDPASDQVFGEGEKLVDNTEPTETSDENFTKELTLRQPSNLPLKDYEETNMHGQPIQDESPRVNTFEGNIELLSTKEVASARLEKPNRSRIRKNVWGKKKTDAQNKVFKVIGTVPDEVEEQVTYGKGEEQDEIPQVSSAESNFEIVFGDLEIAAENALRTSNTSPTRPNWGGDGGKKKKGNHYNVFRVPSAAPGEDMKAALIDEKVTNGDEEEPADEDAARPSKTELVIANDDKESKTAPPVDQNESPRVNTFEGNIELLSTKEVASARLEKPNRSRIRKNVWGKKKTDAQNKVFKVIGTVPDEVEEQVTYGKGEEQDEIPQVSSAESNFEIVFGDLEIAAENALRTSNTSPTRPNRGGNGEKTKKGNHYNVFRVPSAASDEENMKAALIDEKVTNGDEEMPADEDAARPNKTELVIANDDKESKNAPPVEMITRGEEKEPVDQVATKSIKAGVAPSQRESASKIEAEKEVTHIKTDNEIFDETKVPPAPFPMKFHLNATTRKRYFAKTVGSSELKNEEERRVPHAIPGDEKVDESMRESATSSKKKNKWFKKKDKQYKVLKISAVATDKKKFKTMPPVEMAISGGEENEPTNTNRNMSEMVNEGNENEPAGQDLKKPSTIGLVTSGLENEAEKKISVTSSLSSVQGQTQNEASFWSQPPALLSSDILNTPMEKFNQLMTCASTCMPLFDAHSVIAAARNNQTTEPVASVEEKLAAKDDELKLLQAKVKHRNQKNMTLSLQVTKLKLDIADFTVKVRELEQLYAQTSYEAVRAKKEETSSVLPILGKCKRN